MIYHHSPSLTIGFPWIPYEPLDDRALLLFNEAETQHADEFGVAAADAIATDQAVTEGRRGVPTWRTPEMTTTLANDG